MTLPKPTPREPAAPKPIPRRAVDRRARRAKRRAKVARLPRIGPGTWKQQVAELDRLCADAVRERDGHRCTLCGVPEQGRRHDWAHIISRRYYATRWDWRNSTTLCRTHHQKYTRNPDAWWDLVEAKMGYELIRAMRAHAMARTGKQDLGLWRLAVKAGPQGVKPW